MAYNKQKQQAQKTAIIAAAVGALVGIVAEGRFALSSKFRGML